MSDGPNIRDMFFEECVELLEALDEGLTAINDGAHDPDTVNAVFRAVHSIKGGAGAFGLDDLVGFAHTFETLFDDVRSGRLNFDPTLIQLLFRAGDFLNDLVAASRDEIEPDHETRQSLIGELSGYLAEGHDEPEEEIVFEAMTLDLPDLDGPPLQDMAVFRITLKPHKAMLKNGHEPLFLIKALEDLGTVSVEIDLSELPEFSEIDVEDSYLGWTVELTTEKNRMAIDEVFEFVDGLCELSIEELTETQEPEPEPVETVEATAPVALPGKDVAETKEPKAKEPANSGPKPTLRVDLERVDRLINTVGELIINQAMLSQRVSEVETADMTEILGELDDYKLLARDIQEAVMAIRAQSVKPLFQRMARIVREASHTTAKPARLVMVGESTEVDKTIIEKLADPLTHMIRNAVDHGLEDPDKRKEAGKPEMGNITLSASHRSGSVYIEIKDDGAGLNRAKIYDIAQTKGLIPQGIELSDMDIDNLLFLPGFSTATEVSNLSGRGVGMDVVKNAVAALGGRVAITSTPGEGTVFSIVLPLTMAVMDGMVISVAGHMMVVPITAISETVLPTPSSIHRLGAGGLLLAIRDTFVPIVGLAQNLGLAPSDMVMRTDVLLLVETESGALFAMAVDEIHDQRQVVIKSLEGVYGTVPGVSAATILGDGNIAMIVDPEGVLQITPKAVLNTQPLPDPQENTHDIAI